MNLHMLFGMSILLNVLLAAILWRWFRWRQQTKAMLHSLLKLIKINSATIRRVKFEPWKDEHVRAAEDSVDKQFGIVFNFLNPHESVLILDAQPELAVPLEPGSDN